MHEFAVLGPYRDFGFKMSHMPTSHIHGGSVLITRWLFVVSNTFSGFKSCLDRQVVVLVSVRRLASEIFQGFGEFGIIRILRILPCHRRVSMRHKIHRF